MASSTTIMMTAGVLPTATDSVAASTTSTPVTPVVSSTHSSSSGPNAEQFVGLFQLTLLFIILFFATAQIPRAIARFNHSRGGFLLQPRRAVRQTKEMIRRSLYFGSQAQIRTSALIPPPPQRKPTVKRPSPLGRQPPVAADPDPFASATVLENPFDDKHARQQQLIQFTRSNSQKSTASNGSSNAAVPPIHVPAWNTIFYPIVGWMASPFFKTGFNWGQIVVYALYTGMFLFVMFFNTHGTDNLKRAGWLGIAQAPLVISLGAKNSLVGVLLGRGYDKLNFIHRWIGKFMFIASFFHVMGYIVLWLRKNIEGKEASAHLSAWVAFAGLSFIAISSLPVFRRLTYNLFFHSHWIGFTIFLVAICYHVPDALYWSLAAFFLLGLDHVARLVKSYYTTVNLQAIPELRTTRIEIPHISGGWRAGQHVRLRAFSVTQMGVLSCTEAHPFTISSVAQTENDDGEAGQGLVLYAKSAGDWTGKLYDAASRYERGGSALGGFGKGATMKMIVEGPYGGGHAMYSSFTSSFIVVGGSGITYGLSVVEELVRDIEDSRARTRLIQLVWIVQDPSALVPLLPTLASFLERVEVLPTVQLKLSIHYTRASTLSVATQHLRLPHNAKLEAGRPDFNKLLGGFVARTDRLSKGAKTGLTGVVVGVCGPKELAESVKTAERTLDRRVRKSVGGVEVIEETFSW